MYFVKVVPFKITFPPYSSSLKSVWPASAQLLLAPSVRYDQVRASIAWCRFLFTYLVEQQPDQAAACCESLFTGLALYFPFDILSCCESLYSNRRHNLCVSRQVGARATCHTLLLLCGQRRRRVCVTWRERGSTLAPCDCVSEK